jgi:hypothetical protein
MPYEEVKGLLRTAGARDDLIESGIGFGPKPDSEDIVTHSWWVLPDGTALLLLGHGPTENEQTVSSIEIGPRGKGYEGKIKWFENHSRVEELVLADYDMR